MTLLPYPVASHAAHDAYEALYDAQNEVACLMLGSMSPELQRTFENYKAYDMIQELKTMFEEQAKQELFETGKAFHACKQEDGQSVSSYLLKVKSYLDTLECLGYAMPKELDVSLILNSLNNDYDQFVHNYNMHSMGKTLAELHAMLKLYEKGIPKKAETPDVLVIHEGKIQKDKKKPQGVKGKAEGKNKLAYAPKTKISPPPKRDNPAKDSICHHCKEGLRGSRKLKYGALSLYIGNGMRKAVEAIRSFDLILLSGLIIVLDNYNVFYFNAIPHNGIYEIDMHSLYLNVSSNYNVSNKRAKHGLDSYFLWHCRLGHINKERMDMLQHDGLLQPTHDESHEKCKSCISRKMAHKPFPHQVERAKDLLGLIHTDMTSAAMVLFIKVIRSNRGGEYMSHEFVNHMKSYGIVSQQTPPYTPQHNGVSERRNRTLLDMVRSMMNLKTLPKSFWGYALEIAARILNMVLTKKVDRTPYEIWYEKASKSIKCIFVGYPKEMMGYYFYYPLENKIFVSRNAEFFENSFMVQEASGSHELLKMSRSDKGLEIIQEEDTQPSKNTSKEHNEVAPIEVEPQNVRVPIRRSAMIPQVPDRYGYYVDVEEYELGDLDEPPNYKAALADPESDKWLEAMNTEMQSMKDNQVWYLVDLPSNG
ncbi:retrotransposon protein, putative, ty1-copia subclass [Tanacetum coccineum]